MERVGLCAVVTYFVFQRQVLPQTLKVLNNKELKHVRYKNGQLHKSVNLNKKDKFT